MKVDVVDYIEQEGGGAELVLDLDQQAVDHFVRIGVIHALTESLTEMVEDFDDSDQLKLDF
jgi:hypothetical protein